MKYRNCSIFYPLIIKDKNNNHDLYSYLNFDCWCFLFNRSHISGFPAFSKTPRLSGSTKKYPNQPIRLPEIVFVIGIFHSFLSIAMPSSVASRIPNDDHKPIWAGIRSRKSTTRAVKERSYRLDVLAYMHVISVGSWQELMHPGTDFFHERTVGSRLRQVQVFASTSSEWL